MRRAPHSRPVRRRHASLRRRAWRGAPAPARAGPGMVKSPPPPQSRPATRARQRPARPDPDRASRRCRPRAPRTRRCNDGSGRSRALDSAGGLCYTRATFRTPSRTARRARRRADRALQRGRHGPTTHSRARPERSRRRGSDRRTDARADAQRPRDERALLASDCGQWDGILRRPGSHRPGHRRGRAGRHHRANAARARQPGSRAARRGVEPAIRGENDRLPRAHQRLRGHECGICRVFRPDAARAVHRGGERADERRLTGNRVRGGDSRT